MNYDDFVPVKAVYSCTIDSSNYEETVVGEPVSRYILNGKPVVYKDFEFTKVVRDTKLDPMTLTPVKNGFEFPYMWDPYTGERLDEDPYGALHFDPVVLGHYFYVNRLRKLWVEPVDDSTGYYQGYYDTGVGSGDNFFVSGRGDHPEMYLFRIPLSTYYLTEDHNMQVVTFGPKLTDEEIQILDNKLQDMKETYRMYFNHNPPSLTIMKQLYDQALFPAFDEETSQVNRTAVDKLVQMKG